MQHDSHVRMWRAHRLLRAQLEASVTLIKEAVDLVAMIESEVAMAG